ncbi:MAG TPA: Rieske 2Fe-2S domain-containing protein [Candidatus Binatia bacterium]|nr:Rieske 2Fe-2S domain-containing protein [Candidatus Binatia bacterium]
MLTAEENETLTRVGHGTPMGNLLRRYWFPVATISEMDDRWTKRVKLLGEDLVLFKDRQGRYGLIAEFCPHRRASLAYGIPQQDGIRCPYHGWKFDRTGACIEQPNEPEGSSFKEKIKTAGYPVEKLGGLLWAYLGPLPAPLVPRFDGYVTEPAIRLVGQAVIPCNWLQIMENSVDPVHTEWLHGKLYEFRKEKEGEKVAISKHHLNIAFDEFEYGVYKRRLLEGEDEATSSDWLVGHPVLFPYTLSVGQSGGPWKMHAFQIRVPMDDTHTMHMWYNAYIPPEGADVPRKLLDEVPVYDAPFVDENGEYLLDIVDAQDIMAWVTQGPIADRTLEALGTADRGVILFRNILWRELKNIEEGRDPMGVVRDPAKNRIIEIPMERAKAHYSDGFASMVRRTRIRFSPIADDLIKVFTPKEKEREYVGAR